MAHQRSRPKPAPVRVVEKTKSKLAGLILFFYNAAQFLLWSMVGYDLVQLVLEGGSVDQILQNTYSRCAKGVLISQKVAFLEIAFVLAGFLKAPLVSVIMQLIARNIVILFTIQQTTSPVVLESPAIMICFVAWTLADLPRFAWLLLKTFTNDGVLLGILTSIRYSSFIILYPLGGVGEAWSMFNALGLGEKRDLLDVGLGLEQHQFVDLDIVVKYVYFPLFVPGFLFLYFNMLKKRSKRNSTPNVSDRKNQ